MMRGVYIKQLSDSLSKAADNNLSKIGVTFSQISILVYLKNQPKKSATYKEIEKEMKVSQPAIVGLAQRLQAKGFAKSSVDEKDKRVKHLHITSKGEEICDLAQIDIVKTEENLVRALSDEEKQQFTLLLKKVAESLE